MSGVSRRDKGVWVEKGYEAGGRQIQNGDCDAAVQTVCKQRNQEGARDSACVGCSLAAACRAEFSFREMTIL